MSLLRKKTEKPQLAQTTFLPQLQSLLAASHVNAARGDVAVVKGRLSDPDDASFKSFCNYL